MTQEIKDNLILIIGVEGNGEPSATDAEPQRSLVGVATSLDNASMLVGEDYVEICKQKKLNAMFNTPYSMAISNVDGGSAHPGYCMNGYTWHFVYITPDQLENFTL